jgi:plasmid stabilization system protein ParE
MAYKVKLNKRFVKKSLEIAEWIEKRWSKKEADKFVQTLNRAVLAISFEPGIGSSSSIKKDVRKFSITKQNTLYYRVSGSRIVFLLLFDTRRNPKKNKYK